MYRETWISHLSLMAKPFEMSVHTNTQIPSIFRHFIRRFVAVFMKNGFFFDLFIFFPSYFFKWAETEMSNAQSKQFPKSRRGKKVLRSYLLTIQMVSSIYFLWNDGAPIRLLAVLLMSAYIDFRAISRTENRGRARAPQTC